MKQFKTTVQAIVVFAKIIRAIDPFRAIVESVIHRGQEFLTAVDVAAHWHNHFKDQVSESERILKDQAVCFCPDLLTRTEPRLHM